MSALSLCSIRCANARGALALRRCQWPAGFGCPATLTDINPSGLAVARSLRDLEQRRQPQISRKLIGVPHGEELSLSVIRLFQWTMSLWTTPWTPAIKTGRREVSGATIWGYAEFFHVIKHAKDPDWLNAEELDRLNIAAEIALKGWNSLETFNRANNKARWRMRPKHHAFYHINEWAQETKRNPASTWTFKDEDMMGRISKIVGAVHGATLGGRTLERWCMQFFEEHTKAL